MTELQFKRWRRFSLRFAHRAFPRLPRKSRTFVAGCVKDFFRTLASDYLRDAEPPDVGVLARIRNWDHTDSHPTWRDPHGHASYGPYVCDVVSNLREQWNPYYWADDARTRRWDDLWGNRIHCAIRAGIDVAAEPSMGVMGFTAGDVRRMYRVEYGGRVPDWVTGGRKKRWTTQHWKGVVPGVGLVPGKRTVNGTFEKMPDDAQLWL